MDVSLGQFLGIVQSGSPVLFLGLFIYGLDRGWWVLGAYHRKIEEDRDYWRQKAESALLDKQAFSDWVMERIGPHRKPKE